MITILEHIEEIHYDIYTTKVLKSHVFEELEKLRVEAEGGEARTITGCLVDIILAVVCFWMFGPWIGAVATFIAIAIVYSIENKIRKIRNISRDSEIKKFKLEYEAKKEPMEKDMERYSTEIQDLESDLIYRYYKYVFEWIDGRYDITVGTMIDVLQSGKADTIETAIRCQGVSVNNIEDYKNATLSRGEPEIMQQYLEAAKQGNIRAQCFLGKLSYRVDDKQEALKWYLSAAENGMADAQFICGKMYYNGEGIAIDKKEALKWFSKAAEQGHQKAKQMYDECND